MTVRFGVAAVLAALLGLSPASGEWMAFYRSLELYRQGDETFQSAMATSDGSLLVATSVYRGLGDFGSQVTWLTQNGETPWKVAFDTPLTIEEIALFPDGGFAVAGTSLDSCGFIIRFRDDGSIAWQNAYCEGWTWLYSLDATEDGGVITTGFGPGRDILVMKLDRQGRAEWNKVFDGEGKDDSGLSVRSVTDGGYILAGVTAHSEGRRSLVMKLSADGEREWAKTYGANGMGSIEQLPGGGFVVLWNDGLLWIDEDGVPVSRITSPVDLYSVRVTEFGEYLLSGQLASECGVLTCRRAWVMKLGTDRSPLWQAAYGGGLSSSAISTLQTPNGGHMMLAHVSLGQRDDSSDLVVGRMNSQGEILGCTDSHGYVADVILQAEPPPSPLDAAYLRETSPDIRRTDPGVTTKDYRYYTSLVCGSFSN